MIGRRLLRTAAVTASLMIGTCYAAYAENRIALVIGQSKYQSAPALPNPITDAAAISGLLQQAGFEVVGVSDLTQLQMREVIADFTGKVAAKGPDTVVAVFYAGHGVQVDGLNFLMPIDVDLKREADVPLQAVRLDDLMNAVTSVPTKMRIVMLDACRNNPFTEINKTTGRGLAMVDTQAGQANTFISFSTAPGTEAEDGRGSASPYAAALLTAAAEPNLSIEQAFKKVRLSVNQATEGRQLPWDSSSLTSDFFFFGNATGGKPGPDTRSVDNWRGDLRGKSAEDAYNLVILADTLAGYEAFAALYPAPPFGNRVRGILERRREMMAWQQAVDLNTAEAFRIFLQSYPTSDLSATARKLQERQRNRALAANAALTPNPNPTRAIAIDASPANNAGGPPNATPASLANPVSPIASGPLCPCTIPPPLVKKASAPPPPPPPRAKNWRPPPGPPPGPPPHIRAQQERDARDAAVGGAIAAGVIGGLIGGAIAGGGRGGGYHH